MNPVAFVAGQILGGMLANPTIINGEIYWDDLIKDALAKARDLVNRSGDGVIKG